MKITFVCAVFPPEPEPAGVMAHQLAARLARNGHEVSMVVPIPNRPHGILYPGFRRRFRSRTVTGEGYSLVRCVNWLIGKQRKNVNRILENVTFGLSSVWAVWREGRPDVIILESWPLFATSFCACLARCWRVPYLYYVQDIYPEAAENAGVLASKGTLTRACRQWDRWICSNSAKVIVISETMQRLLTTNRRLPPSQFMVIPNWIDESAFPVWQGCSKWRSSQGIPDNAFVAMFAGTMGHVSGVEVLVEVAALLREVKNLVLLCIGEGVQKQPMQEGALRMGLTNIHFLPFQPPERVPEIHASSNVTLLTMHPNSSHSSVPSKLVSYLAAARPVICAVHGESAVAQVVKEAKAGFVVDPGNARAIALTILRIRSEPKTAFEMGRNARRYFEEYCTLERAYRQFSELLRQTETPKPRQSY